MRWFALLLVACGGTTSTSDMDAGTSGCVEDPSSVCQCGDQQMPAKCVDGKLTCTDACCASFSAYLDKLYATKSTCCADCQNLHCPSEDPCCEYCKVPQCTTEARGVCCKTTLGTNDSASKSGWEQAVQLYTMECNPKCPLSCPVMPAKTCVAAMGAQTGTCQ